MTTVIEKRKRCAVCGKTRKYTELSTTNAFGSPDLDTRPPEMARSTMKWWIQRCPSCGYCTPNVSKRIRKCAEVVRSAPYQEQLKNLEFPRLANAFLCYSMLEEGKGDYTGAGQAAIYAAWACDDAGVEASARECRTRAVILLQKAKGNRQKFSRQRGADEALLVDLLRRAGQFEAALKACEDGYGKKPGRLMRGILEYQRALIGRSDVARHTVAEASDS